MAKVNPKGLTPAQLEKLQASEYREQWLAAMDLYEAVWQLYEQEERLPGWAARPLLTLLWVRNRLGLLSREEKKKVMKALAKEIGA